ncbi:MAG: hypothetical protein ACW98D_07360 [Promethearchaeota archaeon]|jgi:hypothetical protein
MMRKKIFVLTITALLFMGVIFSVNGYHEYIKTWEGPQHTHCGHDASTPSVLGSLVLSINETGNLSPYQAFELEIDVLNFTESLGDPFYGRIMVGVPGVGALGVVIDNARFALPLGEQRFNRRESVDAYGSYDPGDTDNIFTLLAPGVAGTYDLMGLAIAGVNQSSLFADTVEHAEVNISYIEEIIQITVVGTPPVGDSIPGFITLVLLSSVGTTVLVVVLTVRRKKRIVE